MKKIKSIHINNFKFFADNKPIEINEKHLLLYGENGSGKSSIFWALHALLESANKNSVTEIQKYFDKAKKENLVNIFATDNTNSFVELTLQDDTTYKISFTDIETIKNEELSLSNLASDFINYRFLFKIQNHKRNQIIDLFEVFENEIFNNILFKTVGDVFDEIDGERKPIKRINAGRLYNLLTTKESKKEFKTTFKEGLLELISHISQRGSQILIDKFGIFHLLVYTFLRSLRFFFAILCVKSLIINFSQRHAKEETQRTQKKV